MTPLEQLLGIAGSLEGDVDKQASIDPGSLSIATIFRKIGAKQADLSRTDLAFAQKAAEQVKRGETLEPRDMQRLLELAGV